MMTGVGASFSQLLEGVVCNLVGSLPGRGFTEGAE